MDDDEKLIGVIVHMQPELIHLPCKDKKEALFLVCRILVHHW